MAIPPRTGITPPPEGLAMTNDTLAVSDNIDTDDAQLILDLDIPIFIKER